MNAKSIRKYCVLDNDCKELLKLAMTKKGLSARAYDRIIKVSRTIADLEESAHIKPSHISEAVMYRSLDTKFWE
jgi:magnesium chelatase family protein